MKRPGTFSRRSISALCVALGLGAGLPHAIAQTIPYTPAYPNAFNAGCNGDHIERTSGFNAEARIDPEWAQITSTPTILEGTVATPGQLYDGGEGANNQAASEVAETDIPWTHYTHDKTTNVQPDADYKYLLSSWADVNGNVQAHHTFMEVEWDNASTMYELFASSPYFDNQRGAIPQFVWPSVGNRIWVEGQYIFDCGHPGTPSHVDSDGNEVHYKEEVRYSTEIHPPRAIVTFRLNHPTTASLTAETGEAPELPGGDWLPVTGGKTMVPVTEADIFVTARGGGAVDHCSLITRHLDAIDGLLSAGLSGFDSCTHTGPIQTVNDRNYVFDIYPPGTDYGAKTHGLFPVKAPTRDGSGTDVSLQWRVIDHSSDIPDNLGTSIKTVGAIICPVDDKTTAPTQLEPASCPMPPAAHPTRLRVILPFDGADANAFAATILLGWDDVPTLADPQVHTFDVRLEQFKVDHNGESFIHTGDWRVFVDVGGQWKYVSGLPFDRNSNGDNACNGDALTNNGDNDCFDFDAQPWTVSVVDGNPIHIAVGGFESDSVDDEFCTDPTGCDPSTDAGIALALADNDRIGTLDLDLDPAQAYQTGILETNGVDQSNALTFHTPEAGGDGTNYYVTFSAQEVPRAAAPSSTLQVGNPNYVGSATFVTSATPVTLATTSTDDVGFQYRFHRDGLDLPTFATQPFPLHWADTDFAFGPRIATLYINANDGADGEYVLQYSAQTTDGATEPRNTTRLTLDNTPPVAMIVQPTAAQYGHNTPLVLNYSVSDGTGSGVKSFTPKMDGQTGAQFGARLDSGQTIYLYSMSLGGHTFSVDSADNVTNSGTGSVTFTIVVTPDSLIGDVNDLQALGCIDNISQSLIAKISAAKDLIAKGLIKAAINTLSALTHEVQAQAGKHISTTCHDPNGRPFDPVQFLLSDIQYLQASLASQVKANPITGGVQSSTNLPITGMTVNLMSSSKSVAATAITDTAGFYYFADTSGLTQGANYTLKVTLPKGYKSSTPASQSFTWSANAVLGNFVMQ